MLAAVNAGILPFEAPAQHLSEPPYQVQHLSHQHLPVHQQFSVQSVPVSVTPQQIVSVQKTVVKQVQVSIEF